MLSVRNTKTRACDSVFVERHPTTRCTHGPGTNRVLLDLLKQVLERLSSKSRRGRRFVSSMTYPKFRKLFARTSRSLGLQHAHDGEGHSTARLRYNTHSYRRGRCTSCYTSGWTHDSLALYGRWSSKDSVKQYLAQSLAVLVTRGDGNATYANSLKIGRQMIGH